MTVIKFSAGVETEDLAEFVLDGLDDVTLDQVEVERTFADTKGNANEPVTIALALTLGPPLVAMIGRLAEQWLEHRHQDRQVKVLIEVADESPETAKLVEKLMERHADVAVEFAKAGAGTKAPAAPAPGTS